MPLIRSRPHSPVSVASQRRGSARPQSASPAVSVANEATTLRAAWPYLALLLVLSLVPFIPALRGEFLTFDDDAYVSANRFVTQGLTGASVRYAFTTFSEGNYHPLTWLSLILDAQLFGADPMGFHLTSMLLHALNTCLLFLVLGRAGATPAVALLAALLWAVHPTRTESVAWISERKDVLSSTFGLLAVHAYLGRGRSDRSEGTSAIWAAAGWMLLSLLSKAMFVTLPALLVLLDFWPLKRLRTPRDLLSSVVEKWPLWLLTLGFSALAVISQSSKAAMMDLERMPLSHRFPNAVMSYGRYLGLTLWPTDLAAFYPFPVDGWPAWLWPLVGVVLVVITLALLWQRERFPSLLVGWGWYVIALSPVSGLMQTGGQAMADRFTYVPTIGFFLAAIGLLPAAPERRRIAGAIAGAACVVLAAMTWFQAGYWRDTVTLMERTIAVTPLNLYARSSLAHAHMARGDNDQARAMYEEVLRTRPDIAQVHVNLGVIAAAKGEHERAIRHYQDGLAINPASFEAYNNLSAALLEMKRPREAAAALQEALRLEPGNPDALFNLGMAYSLSGEIQAAADTYQQVVELTPNDAEARYRLGVLRSHLGDRAGAEQQLRAALALDPRHAAANDALGQLLSAGGAAR